MSCRYKVGHVNRICQEKRAFQGEEVAAKGTELGMNVVCFGERNNSEL